MWPMDGWIGRQIVSFRSFLLQAKSCARVVLIISILIVSQSKKSFHSFSPHHISCQSDRSRTLWIRQDCMEVAKSITFGTTQRD
jgi:hypothetical protein